MIQITDHLGQIRARVTQACIDADRDPAEVTLVAVSKYHGVAKIAAAYAAGLRNFGESYVSEALRKQDELRHLDITWHFIGRIQSNKTRHIAAACDWVHSVDSVRIARRLNEQRPQNRSALNTLIQVNLGSEPQKGGLPKGEVAAVVAQLAEFPKIQFRGLMTMPPAELDPVQLHDIYAELRDLLKSLNREFDNRADTLSMGMSRDYAIAIAAGSTMIRIGTALFGPREKPA